MLRLNRPVKELVIIALKQAAFRIVPAALLYRLWHMNTRRRPRYTNRNLSGRREIPVQDEVTLHVAWAKVRDVGVGPSASLFVHGEEVMRLDCFGGKMGHMHLNPEQNRLLLVNPTARIYFRPQDMEGQIDQAAFDLERNTQGALLTNKVTRIRNFSLDTHNLSAAAGQMADYMRVLIAEYG